MQLKVREIEEWPDRMLLYGNDPNYYIITDLKQKIKIGDIIEYERYGVNFGWFKRIISYADCVPEEG